MALWIAHPGQAGAAAGDAHAGMANDRIADPRPSLQTDKIDIEAERLTYNSQTRIATASGAVKMTYDHYTLLADEVVYDRRAHRLKARGRLRLIEPGGNVLEASQAQLDDRFRDGFAEHMRLLLTNDATITADYATRKDGAVTVFQRVTYTRCKKCVRQGQAPLWRIRAQQVTHDQNDQRIYYRNASLELLDIPVAWTPYFSHPDPTAKRASGFLTPQISYSDTLGPGIGTPYFWNLAPHYDLTLEPRLYSKQGPFIQGEWRHRVAKGRYSVTGGGVYQTDRHAVPSPGDKRFRGFIASKGGMRIDANWRWGWEATLPSDDTVLRRYDVDDRTDIVNLANAYRLDERSFFTIGVYHFQNQLTTSDDGESPLVAPLAEYNHVFDGPVLGGVTALDARFYAMRRQNALTSTGAAQAEQQSRAIVNLDWQRSFTGSHGQLFTPALHLRSDLYVTSGLPDLSQPAGQGDNDENVTARFLPALTFDARWPWVRHDALGAHLLTPVAQLVVAGNEHKEKQLSNEDAVSVNFDTSNLFLHNRFSGSDRFEGGVRANLGLLYSWLSPDGPSARVSFGESFHLSGENSFAAGSGLDTARSDFVAGLALQFDEIARLSYNMRLDHELDSIREHETELGFTIASLDGTVSYSNLASSPNYGRLQSREQIEFTGQFALSQKWSLFGNLRRDLHDGRAINHSIGLGYECDCFTLKLSYQQDYSDDGDLEKDESVMLHFELKTLGSTRLGTGL